MSATTQSISEGAHTGGRAGQSGSRRASIHAAPHPALVARRVDEQPITRIGWTMREFVLVHSLLGQKRYIPLGKWPLCG